MSPMCGVKEGDLVSKGQVRVRGWSRPGAHRAQFPHERTDPKIFWFEEGEWEKDLGYEITVPWTLIQSPSQDPMSTAGLAWWPCSTFSGSYFPLWNQEGHTPDSMFYRGPELVLLLGLSSTTLSLLSGLIPDGQICSPGRSFFTMVVTALTLRGDRPVAEVCSGSCGRTWGRPRVTGTDTHPAGLSSNVELLKPHQHTRPHWNGGSVCHFRGMMLECSFDAPAG